MGARYFASVIPVLFGLVGAVVANVPITLMGGWMPSPLFALMPIYFWCLVRPDLVSPAWTLIIGILQDMLSGGPPGIWAASFVAMYAMIDSQRDTFAGLSGWGAVLGFATAVLVTCSVAYTIFALYYWKMLPLSPFVMQFAVTVVFYIPAAFLFGFVHRRFVGPLRSDEI
jgi:rod shape-determining protein MreD